VVQLEEEPKQDGQDSQDKTKRIKAFSLSCSSCPSCLFLPLFQTEPLPFDYLSARPMRYPTRASKSYNRRAAAAAAGDAAFVCGPPRRPKKLFPNGNDDD
jgi:hypothetical protein